MKEITKRTDPMQALLDSSANLLENQAVLTSEIRELSGRIDSLTTIIVQDRTSYLPRNKKEITTVVALVIFALAILAIVLGANCGCSQSPTVFDGADTVDTADTVDDTDTVDTDSAGDTDSDTDTDTDSDTDSDTDTDTDTDDDLFCPWECRPELKPPDDWITCNETEYDTVAGPEWVRNYNYPCPDPFYACCQPWPADDEISLADYCLDNSDLECSADCLPGDIDLTKICFNAAVMCCKKGVENERLHNETAGKADIWPDQTG